MTDHEPLLVLKVRQGPGRGKAFVIHNEINPVGSDPDLEGRGLYLPDNSVSGLHAQIIKEARGTWIQDMDSAGGTFVNGRRLTESVWLQPGDEIRFGPAVTLSVSELAASGPDADRTIAPDSTDWDETIPSSRPAGDDQTWSNLAPFQLVVRLGPAPGQRFQLSFGSQEIGRSSNNAVVLPDQAVSRQHARITVQAEGVWIQDAGSSYGTYVNGRPVSDSVWLSPGDQIQLGPSVVLALEATGPAQAASGRRWSFMIQAAGTVIALLVLAAAAVFALRWFFQPDFVVASPFIGPTIRIHRPTPDARAAYNTPLTVHATARDEQGVRRAELWATDKMVAAQNSGTPDGDNPFSFLPLPPWAPLSIGEHLLVIRAYSSDGRVNDSPVLSVDALRIYAERDSLLHITRDRSTLAAVVDEIETSAGEVVRLNPRLEVAATVENKQPEAVELPAGVAISVPANVDPNRLQPPDPPVSRQPPPRPDFEPAPAAPSDRPAIPFSEPPAILDSCVASPVTAQTVWQFQVVEFAAGTDLRPEDVTCYVTIGPRGQTTALRFDTMAPATADFVWSEPEEPVRVQVRCLASGQPPDHLPENLGAGGATIAPEQWLAGSDIDIDADAYHLAFQIVPADGVPGQAEAETQPLAAPRVGKLVDALPAGFGCALVCPGPFCEQCEQVLTWEWQPGAGQREPLCFEVVERVRQAEGLLSERVVRQFTLDPESIGEDEINGAVEVPDLQPERLDCNTETEYFLRVRTASAGPVDSEIIPGLTGPSCDRRATVTFETLTVLESPGNGWERYSALFAAGSESLAWAGVPGLPDEDSTYFLAGPLAGNNTVTLNLSEPDDLTISATISEIIDARWELGWCQPHLRLGSAEVTDLVDAGESFQILEDSAGACQIEVRLEVTR